MLECDKHQLRERARKKELDIEQISQMRTSLSHFPVSSRQMKHRSYLGVLCAPLPPPNIASNGSSIASFHHLSNIVCHAMCC